MKNRTIHFPGLNGLRAGAAIAVVISHITIALADFNLNPFLFGQLKDGKPGGLTMGGYGVSVFFVLSGFLITYLLQAEKDIAEIDIKKFYLRRVLRIWPLYYLYLILSVITILIFGLHLEISTLLQYTFYAANIPFILAKTLPLLAHYWSLGVEEQFYLFWPWVNKKMNKHLVLFIIVFISIMLLVKTGLHVFHPDTMLEKALQITRFHCMMIGALGAILYKQNNRIFLKLTDNKISQGICWIIIFLTALNKFHFASIIDNEIISVTGLVLIIGQIRMKNRVVNLDTITLDFLGKISYGIYVIHPLMIFLFSKILNHLSIPAPFNYLLIYVSIIGTTILLSYLSYNYFEKYFMILKKRYVIINSSPTKFPERNSREKENAFISTPEFDTEVAVTC